MFVLIILLFTLIAFSQVFRWYGKDIAQGICYLAIALTCINLGIFTANIFIVNSRIRQFEAVQETLKHARIQGEPMEAAALTLQIVEANKWLAAQKYYNHTLFGGAIPDAVDELEPLR